MPTWPSTLPNFEVGFQEQRQQGMAITPMDAGPPKRRRRFSAAYREIRAELVLTAAQRTTLDTFFETTLSEGADTFDFTDPKDSATVTAFFMAPPGYTHLLNYCVTTTTHYRASVRIGINP